MQHASESFLQSVPLLDVFDEVMNPAMYITVPAEWYVLITDVKGSTKAIQQGKYKSVNILGVSVIAGVLNKSENKHLPYVFGGDGATMLVPPELRLHAERVLRKSAEIAQKAYGLELRTSLIPVQRLMDEGHAIKMVYFRVSAHYQQAMFMGTGLLHAEYLLKHSSDFQPKDEDGNHDVAYTGIECRWQAIKSPKGEIISLMVEAYGEDDEARSVVYRALVQEIDTLLGDNPGYHPVTEKQLKMGLSRKGIMDEVKLRTFGSSVWERMRYATELRLRMAIGWYLMRRKVATSVTRWGEYKPDLVANSDYRKFDGMFRAVLNSTTEQRIKLVAWLDDAFEKGILNYGIHTSDTALVTCMVFKYQGEHVHFVDGNNGGYAMAAQSFKQRQSIVYNSKKTLGK